MEIEHASRPPFPASGIGERYFGIAAAVGKCRPKPAARVL
jgi:hypothetical protein